MKDLNYVYLILVGVVVVVFAGDVMGVIDQLTATLEQATNLHNERSK